MSIDDSRQEYLSNIDKYNKNNIHYAHFDTEENCANFIKFVTKKNIPIAYNSRCCGGKGVGFQLSKQEVKVLENEFKNLNCSVSVLAWQ